MGRLAAADDRSGRGPGTRDGRKVVVVTLLTLGWLLPGAIATFQPASPLVTAAQRAGDLARSRPVDDGLSEFLDVLSEMRARLPPQREVAIWVEPAPRALGELVHAGAFLYMGSYLLYPRRVFLLATPEIIGELEDRRLLTPPLAAVMRERVSALARGSSPPLDIVYWNRAAPCASASVGRFPGARLESMLPRGACLFAAGGGAN
jgi:hypothetical protein